MSSAAVEFYRMANDKLMCRLMTVCVLQAVCVDSQIAALLMNINSRATIFIWDRQLLDSFADCSIYWITVEYYTRQLSLSHVQNTFHNASFNYTFFQHATEFSWILQIWHWKVIFWRYVRVLLRVPYCAYECSLLLINTVYRWPFYDCLLNGASDGTFE